jgi:pyruvate formate lyase activating enzyme
MNDPSFPLLALSRHRIGIDGVGVTTLVAGAGCPLSCAYCINKKLLCQAQKQISLREVSARAGMTRAASY